MKQKIAVLALLLMVVFSGCVLPGPEPEPGSDPVPLIIEPIDLRNISTEKILFAEKYVLDGTEIELKSRQYDLPLSPEKISNFSDFGSKLELSAGAKNLLEQNGFVVIDYGPTEDITAPYETLKELDVPIFVTSDSLLHLYHIQFDETLRTIEEKEFFDKIWNISKAMYEDNAGKYQSASGDLKEAYKKNAAFFAVGLELLKASPAQLQEKCAEKDWQCQMEASKGDKFTAEEAEKYRFEPDSFVKGLVDSELELIGDHAGFGMSPIFAYQEDYSQYVPRGHYTRSEKLKNYFKGFMWFGRISFLLKGCELDCIVTEEEAKLQTMAASLIAGKFAEDTGLMESWERIYAVTAFYVGLSDDLGPYEYMEALNEVFESNFDPNAFTAEKVLEIKAKLAEYRSPKIYGGTGACVISPPFTPEQADECLENTKGFRFMGQRFIPDSYMFSNLVGQYTDIYLGNMEPKPFTWIVSGAGREIRGFPRGLDVMALLGSKRAKELLSELDDDNYRLYGKAYSKLKEEFNSLDESEWNKNLYWAWLFALKPLLKEYGDGYPSFMQTTAWQDKQLTTALASWTELRHDTILYAKQSYTMAETGMPLPEPPVVGYVEPVPEFYNRLLALTRMTTQGLDEMDVLDDTSRYRLENLETVLERLVVLSKKELENEKLEDADYEFIKNFGDELNNVIADVDEKAKKTTLVADVHTDGNTRQVLEEGVGYVRLVVAAYKVPDGRILLGAGPVFSYYEFKQPMKNRLTDEAWREMLEKGDFPSETEWSENFYSK